MPAPLVTMASIRQLAPHPVTSTAAAAGLAAALVFGAVLPAGAQSRVPPNPLGNAQAPMPEETQQARIEQQLGTDLPLEATFRDQAGRSVRLGDYFDGEKPVLLQFAYFECPMLCPLMQSGIADAVEAVGWEPGEAFEVVTISFDPGDGPTEALEKQAEAVEMLGGPDSELGAAAAGGWHFLTGREADIRAVADAAGFFYAAVPQTADYAHKAVLVFASPGGRITRYLPGHVYPERDFRMAVVEASEGKQGTIFDAILNLCYDYDPTLGQYNVQAMTLMKMAGAVTVVTLAAVIFFLFRFEKKRTARLEDSTPGTPGNTPGLSRGLSESIPGASEAPDPPGSPPGTTPGTTPGSSPPPAGFSSHAAAAAPPPRLRSPRPPEPPHV